LSFSSTVKDEIAKRRVRGAENRRAMLCALSFTAGSMTLGRGIGMQYISENHNVAKLIAQLGPSLYDLDAALAVREQEGLRARKFIVRFSGPGCMALLRDAGFSSGEGDALSWGSIPERYMQSGALRQSFLRGAFLGAGSISNPSKSYHMEIVSRQEAFASELCGLLNGYALNAKRTKRKGSHVVYVKDGEKVADFLRLLGASAGTMDFEHARVLRGVSNNLNRQRNFEEANMQKTALAAAQQRIDIELIERTAGLQSLPKRLYEAAEARLSHPEASLAELSALLNVSKSGLNHRFEKIAERADALRFHE